MQTYILRDPRDGKARYVGATSCWDDRKKAHMNGHRAGSTPSIRDWITELRALGLQPIMEPVDGRERDWMVRLLDAGAPLLNRNLGGGGRRKGPDRVRLHLRVLPDSKDRLQEWAASRGYASLNEALDDILMAL